MSESADLLLFIEEIIEQPKDYGLYDWLLSCIWTQIYFQ